MDFFTDIGMVECKRGQVAQCTCERKNCPCAALFRLKPVAKTRLVVPGQFR